MNMQYSFEQPGGTRLVHLVRNEFVFYALKTYGVQFYIQIGSSLEVCLEFFRLVNHSNGSYT